MLRGKSAACRLLAAAYVAASLALQRPVGADTARLLSRTADQILSHQTPDGAIVMQPVSTGDSRVVPYFANLAAYGLVAAYRDTSRAGYLDAAKRWAAWYAAHQD